MGDWGWGGCQEEGYIRPLSSGFTNAVSPIQEEVDRFLPWERRGGRKMCNVETWDCDTETLWQAQLIATDLGLEGGLARPDPRALLYWMSRRARGQPQLGSIVRGGAHQMPRWVEESASVASGQTFPPVRQGANAMRSPSPDRWTNGYSQDAWRTSGKKGKQTLDLLGLQMNMKQTP